VPLIGFSGSPWTLACYMVEGGGSDDYRLVKTMLYQRPDLMHRILAVNADAVALYLNAQIEAGAQAVMIFDSWGGVLADGAFQEFSLAYTQRVLSQLKKEHDGSASRTSCSPRAAACGWTQIADSGCDVVGLDWTVNLGTGPRPRRQTAWRCKATWTRTCCLPARAGRGRSACGAGQLWRAAARRRPLGSATSSTWATASASTRRRSTSRPWSRRCMPIRQSYPQKY
jgi:hypothetical protein